MIQPGYTTIANDQLLLAAAGSDLVGRKQKNLFYRNMWLFLSVRLYSTEIRPSAGTTTENGVCCNFFKKRMNRKADWDKNVTLLINKQVCLVISSFKITLFTINNLNMQTVLFTRL